MIKDDKTRIQVTMSRAMADELKETADSIGVTTSQLCSVIIGQYLSTQRRSMDMVKNMLDDSVLAALELKGESTRK